ncbi:hypothetical protein [Nocardia donostiensis]|uniref:Uncharacterized protein n=1 Tax=Nocardia donostiensis TaxID=1538463 RepID=A0A1V2TDI2_9NOCA|nr:hypothetical protein [Nocardia donostiensis]ONM47572.1 hypothetical protein B0T46_16870 [Nocardia donostiensis]OQS15084.1 hypothetical protein B0T36_10430 [Nocardia donostiensis]OQS24257.1 hypothetical protein B0T44_01165 [Nocardia donostiensis]
MQTLITNLNALWQVTAAALLLGAGLPIVFAVGVRCWSSAETVDDEGVVRRNYPALAGAVGCLLLVLGAVVTGILYTARAFIAARLGIHLFGE